MREGWTYKKLVDECSILYGYPFDSKCFSTSPDDMPLIRIRDVKEGKTSTFYNGDYPKDYIIHKGDYLIGMDGEFNISPWQSEDALLNQRVCKISCNTSSLLIRYVYRFLIKELKKIEDETPFVTVKHLSAKKINQINIPVPPIAEQERIVAELDLLQGIIEKKKEQLKAYDQLAQSIFYTMFGDPIDNPKGWEVKKLKDVTTKIGSGATPKGGNQSYKNEGISLIRSLNVHNGSFKYEDLAHIDEQQAHQLNNVIVEENDVLFNITGASVARCCIVPFDVLPARVNQHVSILRPKKEIVNHVYLCYYLISPNSQNTLLVMSKSNAATREALPKSMMEKYSICVPPLSLQQEFAEKVEAIERQKALVQQSIEETQTMFDYTMDKYFG